MVPAPADQVTEELKLPAPCTDGVHWLVWPGWIVAGRQESVTEVMDGTGFTGSLEECPAHDSNRGKVNNAIASIKARGVPDRVIPTSD
jgi:hypothetical protein